MTKIRKVHITLSVLITAIFLCIGAFLCTRSYIRLWETITELGSSIKFYFCEIFEIENSTKVEVIEPSDVIAGEVIPVPSTPSMFWLKVKAYFTLLVNGKHLGLYFSGIGEGVGNFARILVLLIPIVVLMVLLIRKIYNTPNTNHNHDTAPLRAFKKVSGITYQPIKRFVLGYRCFLDNNPKRKTIWLWLWLGNVNFLSIIVAFIFFRISSETVPYALTSSPLGGETENGTRLSQYDISLNGTPIEYETIEILDTLGHPATGGKRPFSDHTIAVKLSLKKGVNVFSFVTANMNGMGGTMAATAPVIDCIKVTTSAELSWNPVLTNEVGQ